MKNIKHLIIFILLVKGIEAAEWQSYTNANFINYLIGDVDYLYCATRGGLAVFSFADSSFTKVFTNTDGLSTNRINCLLFDKFHNIWIGTHRGISTLDTTTDMIANYDRFGEINQTVINCLARAGDTILIGTKNGLYLIDTRGTISISDDNLIVPNFPTGFTRNIFSISVDNDFWVGVSPGIVRLNRNLQSYTYFIRPFGDSVKSRIFLNDTLFI
ncbi:MAG: hypothetical protein N2748_00560, partial [candidate division WOR-3 bacterium]|nr:hypothetical protein [candidate division WOR-3 bacterium]